MANNIFMKSILRQPVRTALLALLLAVAAFSFVMRGVEYIVINEKIDEIGGFYRPIGFLGEAGLYEFADVRPGAEIVSGSPYVDFGDLRRTVEAVLLDVTNTNTPGNTGRMVGRHMLQPQDAFFSGTLTGIRHGGNNPYIVLTFEVDSVTLGYPEHVREGQTLDVHYFMDSDEIQSGATAIDGMAVGERYFLRGAYYDTWIARESGNPFPFNDLFVMHPLSEITYGIWGERDIPRDGVWYATAPSGEPVDLFIPGLESLYAETQWIEHSLGMVSLQTTVDMSYMPFMQPRKGARCVLTEGRWVNREDNELSRPVVAVHEDFAARRGLAVGDTLRIGIPPEQRADIGAGTDNDGYILIYVVGEAQAPYTHTMELEIVGTFSFTNTAGMLGGPWATTLMYMPDSVLPPDVALVGYERTGTKGVSGGEVLTIPYEDGYILAEWYSFVLNDPRDADAFVAENREALGELGFSIEFLPGLAGAKAFWESAEAIMQTVSFNLALFSVVSALVLVLAVFLYIRQRQRDYAILRALGNPARRTNRQLISTLMLFALPAVTIGGAGGWLVALSESARALEALPNTGQAGIGAQWLPTLIIAVLAGLFILALIGIAARRRPILEMLQGGAANRAKEKTAADTAGKAMPSRGAESAASDAMQRSASTSGRVPPKTTGQKRNVPFFIFQFIFRHIARQRAKTQLAAMMALFFMLALGYLQTAIDSTALEVDRLYNNTVVTGEVRQADLWESAPGRFHNNVVRPQTIEGVAPLVKNELITACHEFAVLTAASEDGSLPGNWDELAGININALLTDNLPAFDTLVGVNDLERYARANSHRAGDEFTGFSWKPSEEVPWVTDWRSYTDNDFLGMQINFAQGFDPEDFVFAEGDPVPIIINNRVMDQNGYELGDVVYVGASTMLNSLIWDHTPAVIVGIYNLSRLTNDIFFGAIMPVAALRHIVGDELRFIAIQFEIDPVHNREMERVRDEIGGIAEDMGAGEVPLGLFLEDEELRMVVIPMEQNLSLLRLLYPIAIALSAIIGFGLSVLLTLQSAKVAAIMRVLGTTRKRSRATLCAEQVVVCLFGLALGLIALAALGWGFGFVSSLGLAGVYLAGAALGTIVGAVVVTNRPPLELLQVKE